MVRPGSSAPLWGAAGKAGYALSCVAAALVLAVSGFSYFVVRDVSSIGGSHAIVSGPSIGAQNILLMGLESRTDWNGNILPNNILNALHAGSGQGVENGVGGNATNTLILIHIPAGGKKAVGFSIPRDDWVNFADTLGTQQVGKIDQAYGVSMAAEEAQLRTQDPGMSQNQFAFQGNEAGPRGHGGHGGAAHRGAHRPLRRGQPGRVLRARQGARRRGGLPQPPGPAMTPTPASTPDKAGYQHLNAAMALAFVRQRDGLTNGDLDRTHRQQAFLDSVMQQLRTEGVLSDLTKINSLLSVAKQYVITDSGWNLLDFASQMRSLTSGNLTFRTLPIVGYETIDGQDANAGRPALHQADRAGDVLPGPRAAARQSSARQPEAAARPTPAKTTVDVYNGGNTAGLAGQVSAALVKDGYKAGQIGNTSALTTTEVLYGAGSAASASKIAALFGVTATASSTVAAGHVEILLGADATRAGQPAATPTSSSSAVPIPTTGAQGGAVNAKNGIPCVN